jgi:hypothetical protein
MAGCPDRAEGSEKTANQKKIICGGSAVGKPEILVKKLILPDKI